MGSKRDPLIPTHFRRERVAIDTRPLEAELKALTLSPDWSAPDRLLDAREPIEPDHAGPLASFVRDFSASRGEIAKEMFVLRFGSRDLDRERASADDGPAGRKCFHLVVKSRHGTRMTARHGDPADGVTFQQGELWWVDDASSGSMREPDDVEPIHVAFETIKADPA